MWDRLVRGIVVALLWGLLVACGGNTQSPSQPSVAPTTAGNHGAGDAHGTPTDAPFDALFIDGMIEHHQGAITMAGDALDNSERPEVRTLAEAIVAAQGTEIEQMTAWRTDWYPGLAPTEGMGVHMGDMEVSADESIPYDRRFLMAMISHHRGAIDMAREAQANAEHAEIKTLAQAIITTQEAEIAQMEAWLQAWFPE